MKYRLTPLNVLCLVFIYKLSYLLIYPTQSTGAGLEALNDGLTTVFLGIGVVATLVCDLAIQAVVKKYLHVFLVEIFFVAAVAFIFYFEIIK